MVSELGRYYKGAFPIPELMKLTFKDFYFWYRIYEREIIEDSIISKLKDKPIPSRQRLKRMVDKEIAERKAEVDG